MENKTFFIVVREVVRAGGNYDTNQRHATHREALEMATGLAQRYHTPFIVCQAVYKVELETPPVKVTDLL